MRIDSPFITGSAQINNSLTITGSLTVSGPITAQTLVVQTITSSTVYSSGSNIFGNVVTNTHQFTGSVSISGSLAVNNNSVITSNQTSSMSVLSSSYSAVSTNAATASHSDNFTVSAKLTIDQTLTDFARVLSSIVGSNNLFTQATGSYTSAFFKYTAANGTNARSGEVIVVWNGTTAQFTDFSTLDVGGTTDVTASSAVVAGDIQFNIQTNTSGWLIKSLATFI